MYSRSITDERLGKRFKLMADKLKILGAVLLVILGVAGYYYLGDKALIWRVLAVLAGLVSGGVLFTMTAMGQDFKIYTQQSVDETRKVVWPTRKETIQTTIVVFVFVVLMAVILWLVDASLLWVIKKIIGRS
jgi:preprotein translocase subunit SecE